MTFGSTVKQYREIRGLSQAELAKIAGYSSSFISRIEDDQYKHTSPDTIISIARALKIKPEELYRAAGIIKDKKADYEIPQMTPSELISELQSSMPFIVPIRGSIPAGIPAVREEEVEGYVAIHRDEIGGALKKNLYALRVSGDSLEGDNICNGDLIVIDPDSTIIEGKIYVVRLGNEMVARHIHNLKTKLRLSSSNSHYKDIDADDVEIMGRVILTGNWRKV